MRLALMLPRSIRVEWQFPIKRRLEKRFAIASLRGRNTQQANTHHADRKPDTIWQNKSDLISDLSALNMTGGRSFQVSAKIKPCQSLNVMGNSSLFTDRSVWVTHSQRGLNFQSPSHSPSNPTRGTSATDWLPEWFVHYCDRAWATVNNCLICSFSAQAHIRQGKDGGAKLKRETRAVCVFPQG